MSVSIKSAGTDLQVETPVALFQSSAFQGNANYEVSRDGRFLLNIPISEQAPSAIGVILNWASAR
jgi:hypothetical protein